MDWEQILVIILGVGFAVLLILSIIFISILILIVRSIRRLTRKAEDATDDIAATLKLVGKRLVPVAISTLIAAIFGKAKRKREKRHET